MKKDLKDCTFIIPIRIESTDRLRNVITILCYLNSNFDTNIIVKEVDKESIFDKSGLCLLYTSPSPRDGLLSRMPSSA